MTRQNGAFFLLGLIVGAALAAGAWWLIGPWLAYAIAGVAAVAGVALLVYVIRRRRSGR